jgi:hypothetical protein
MLPEVAIKEEVFATSFEDLVMKIEVLCFGFKLCLLGSFSGSHQSR